MIGFIEFLAMLAGAAVTGAALGAVAAAAYNYWHRHDDDGEIENDDGDEEDEDEEEEEEEENDDDDPNNNNNNDDNGGGGGEGGAAGGIPVLVAQHAGGPRRRWTPPPPPEKSVTDLAEFLRKNQRALRISTLQLLDTLNNNYQTSLTPPMSRKVLAELPALINESDLQIAQMTLALLTIMLKYQPTVVVEFIDQILSPPIARLIQSPLLQGTSLQALNDFLLQLMQCGLQCPSFAELKSILTKPIFDCQVAANVHKQCFHSAAKCLATLVAVKPQEAPGVVNSLIDNLNIQGVDQQVQLFSLLALGEIGRKSPKSISDTRPPIDQIIMRGFQSQNEEVKTAASLALGGVAVGNLEKYLPIVLKEIETQPKRQYLLLHALKEIISSESSMIEVESVSAIFKPHIDQIWMSCIGEFLQTLTDPDLNVRRVALVTFNSAAHNKPSLVKGDILTTVLPHVYAETNVRRELIREVEMGPFKHTVDDGLDLRKAAFECMYTLLDTCLERLDIFEFLSHVEDGLKDHYDIKMLTYLMLIRLASLCPTQTLQRLDRLVDALKQTCVQKVKANSVKQEYEKQDELKRCALRAVCAVQAIPDTDKSPQLRELMSMIRTTPELACLYDYFLSIIGQWFDLVIYTASMEIYGAAVSDKLDMGRGLLTRRYFRQHCTFDLGGYSKDLSSLDNSIGAYRQFPDNAIPIKSWFSDPSDTVLLNLLPFLDCLRYTSDVRSVLSRNLHLHRYASLDGNLLNVSAVAAALQPPPNFANLRQPNQQQQPMFMQQSMAP